MAKSDSYILAALNAIIDARVDACITARIQPILEEIDRLRKETQAPTTRHGKLFSSKDAWEAIKVSERQFRDLVRSGLIAPLNPEALTGDHHKFTKSELDHFLNIPSATVRSRLAMWRAEQKRKKGKLERTGKAPLPRSRPTIK